MKKNSGFYMRLVHRYLGFFLAGIMAIYALSGVLMIFRQTDFLKQETHKESQLKPALTAEELGREIKIKDLEIQSIEGDILHFDQGQYNKASGMVNYTTKELPLLLGKMTKLHKATTNSPVYFLNIFFGTSLLFFVISAFWMFLPHTSVFKRGLYFTLGGIALTLLLLFV